MGLGLGVGSGLAGGILATEICAPLLLLCWLCCWPDDSKSDSSSSGKHPRKPVIAQGNGDSAGRSRPRRKSSELFGRRFGSSAVSLHLPGTSGHKKQPLSAHRSHEEIRGRRKSHVEDREDETRYHSAPSVIDEVLHRRDWERSSKQLYIPLNPQPQPQPEYDSDASNSSNRIAESSISEDETKNDAHASGSKRICKKHYTNIKSSRNKIDKESNKDDIKDQDATELGSSFYIGDAKQECPELTVTETKPDNDEMRSRHNVVTRDNVKSVCKEAKQSLNESIKCKERPKFLKPVEENQISKAFDVEVDEIDAIDRSGAMHHGVGSRSSLITCVSRLAYPPLSVEPVGYDGGACYLAEEGTVSSLRASRNAAGAGASVTSQCGEGASEGGGEEWRGLRGRHASDGDILAPAPRPESGAFSESDLDLELSGCEEKPPGYSDIFARADRKETAI